MIFSITFLINQFVIKQDLLNKIIEDYDKSEGGTIESYEEKLDMAKKTLNSWSLPVYFSGMSTIIIFFIFVLFGRKKVEYGYFFRTLWSLIFVGSAIFMFFTKDELWQQLINFFIIIALAGFTLFDLLKVNRKRENIKLELREEWRNKRKLQQEKGGKNV